MRSNLLFLSIFAVGAAVFAAASPLSTKVSPSREVQSACSACHSLDVVRAQRLSREEWAVELRKMMKMGARLRNQNAVLDYLARTYGPR